MVHLNSVAEALDFLSKNADVEVGYDEVELGGELTALEIVVEGKNYHSTVPGVLARGLWEFQEEIYRAVAFALYGDDSIRRLTEDQKAQFELIFKVSEGSSDFLAPLEEFFKKLGEGFKTMNSDHKMKTLIGIAVVVASVYGATKIVETVSESNQKIATTQADTADKAGVRDAFAKSQQAQLEQLKVIADIVRQNPEVKRFAKATEEGTRAVVKSASDATSIKVGRTKLDRESIIEVNQRAAKEASQGRVDIVEYTITSASPLDGGVTKFALSGVDGSEFTGTIFDSEFDAAGLNKMWDAVRKRSKIKLEINKTLTRGAIRQAAILRVVD